MEYYSAHSDEIMGDHDIHFDDERPPTYNAEDYAAHLRKYSSLPDHCKDMEHNSSSKNTKYCSKVPANAVPDISPEFPWVQCSLSRAADNNAALPTLQASSSYLSRALEPYY